MAQPKKKKGGLMNWLGRQVGHVKKAVKAEPPPKVIYRKDRVEEAPMPDQPGVKLRRTVIDEVVVDPNVKKMENQPPAK